MGRKGAANPYKCYGGVDDKAAPFGGPKGSTSGEVKRGGAYKDTKAAGKAYKRGGGSKY